MADVGGLVIIFDFCTDLFTCQRNVPSAGKWGIKYCDDDKSESKYEQLEGSP